MLDVGLTSSQLAALVKDPVLEILEDGLTDYRYSIRYGELIALNTHYDPENLSNGRRTASAKGGIMLKKQLENSEMVVMVQNLGRFFSSAKHRLYRREELPDAFYCFD